MSVLGKACQTDSDCDLSAGLYCNTTNTCDCTAGYIQNGDTCRTCKYTEQKKRKFFFRKAVRNVRGGHTRYEKKKKKKKSTSTSNETEISNEINDFQTVHEL